MIELRDVPVIGKVVGVGATVLHLLGAAPDLVSGVLVFVVSNVDAALPVLSIATKLAGRVPFIPGIVGQYGQQALTGALVVMLAFYLYDFAEHFVRKLSNS